MPKQPNKWMIVNPSFRAQMSEGERGMYRIYKDESGFVLTLVPKAGPDIHIGTYDSESAARLAAIEADE